jgi:glycosyltransferase involved in cell wall biosynthesis
LNLRPAGSERESREVWPLPTTGEQWGSEIVHCGERDERGRQDGFPKAKDVAMGKPWRVAIDVTPAVQGHAGIGRYASGLIGGLQAIGRSEQMELFCVTKGGVRAGGELFGLPARTLRLGNKPWRLSVLAAYLLGLPMRRLFSPSTEVFHATDHLLPYGAAPGNVFTLHDMTASLFPETHLPLNRWYSRMTMRRFMHHADVVIAVSESTKRDAMRIASVPGERIAVIPHGVDRSFCPCPPAATRDLCDRYGLTEGFLLTVGTIEPRKNLVTLLGVLKSLDEGDAATKLVVVGRTGWRAEPFLDAIRDLGVEERVVLTGAVPESDLPAFYGAAAVFLFPSLYEGFGLPVLEAMSCGVPVICSNRASLPEVAGDAAILLAPEDGQAWAEALKGLLPNRALRGSLRERGLGRAGAFTWERTARMTWDVYERVHEGCR